MPTITIYLTNDLYDKIKHAPSKTVRAALEHYFADEDNEAIAATAQPRQPARDPSKNNDTAPHE